MNKQEKPQNKKHHKTPNNIPDIFFPLYKEPAYRTWRFGIKKKIK